MIFTRIINHKPLIKFLYWLWFSLSFIASVIPNIQTQEITIKEKNIRFDYIVHFILFFVLAVLFRLNFRNHFSSKNICLKISGLIVYSVLTETIQFIIPGRSYNPIDLTLNVSGLIAGILLMGLMIKTGGNANTR